MSAKIEKICGIYKIISPSGRLYIGQAEHIYKRWKMYETCIYRTKHRGQPHLYNSLLKYGVSNHKFEIIEICTADVLDEKEMFYIKHFGTFKTPHGMNCCAGGGGRRGYTLSEESKRKISEGNKGRSYSETTLNKMRDAAQKTWVVRKAKGNDKHTESTKKKMSDTLRRKYSTGYVNPLKGRLQSEETVNKRRGLLVGAKNPMYGKPRTEAQKNAQRLRMLGRTFSHTKESKEKLRLAHLGTKASEETKAKMRQSHIGKHNGEKHPRFGKVFNKEELEKHSTYMKKMWEKIKNSEQYNSEEAKIERRKARLKGWETRRLKKQAA